MAAGIDPPLPDLFLRQDSSWPQICGSPAFLSQMLESQVRAGSQDSMLSQRLEPLAPHTSTLLLQGSVECNGLYPHPPHAQILPSVPTWRIWF